MVLYFTGTGNSRYIAQHIAEAIDDELLSMNDRIKAGDYSPVETDERLVIVTPTYAWRIPRIVRDWLAETDFPCGAQAWFVMTCGSEIGNAAQYNYALCQEKQLTYMGTAQIVMPENYIAMFDAPQAEEARQIVAKAEPDIDRVTSVIAANQAFTPPRNNFYDRFMSGPVNPIFYSFFVKANAFAASDAAPAAVSVPSSAQRTTSRFKTASLSGAATAPTAWRASAAIPRKPSSTAKRVWASPGIILRRFEKVRKKDYSLIFHFL